MKISVLGLRNISFIAVVGLFFLRPMFLGYVYTPVGLIILLFGALNTYLFRNKLSCNYEYANEVSSIILKAYIPVQIVAFFMQKIEYALGDFVILVVTVLFLRFFFGFKGISNHFFYVLKFFFIIIIISTTITAYYYYTSEYFTIDNLEIFEVKLRSRVEVGDKIKIFFPFTPLYGYMTTSIIRLAKFNLYFMESGMVPGFFSAIGFIILQKKSTLSYLLYLIFFIGATLSISTALIPCFILPFLANYFIGSKETSSVKWFKFVLLLIIGAYLFYKIPYFGYEAKNETHKESFDDRMSWFSVSIDNLLRYVRLFSALYTIYRIGKLQMNKTLFYSYMSPLIFTGVVNVIFFSPLFLLFCFFNFSNKRQR